MSGERTPRYHFTTRTIHAGEAPEPMTGARGVPIYQSATYAFTSYDQIRSWEDGEIEHFQYTREANPTVAILERKIADIEGAEASVATGTGMAAISAILLHFLSDGGHAIAGDQLYGHSGDLFDVDLPGLGAQVTRLDLRDLAAVEAAIQPNTKLIFAETVSNPYLRVADIPALAELAHRNDAVLAVDNTFLSPVLYRPLEDGADLVMHSATKYLSGSGQTLGGVISGRRELVQALRERIVKIGSGMAPFTAWLIIGGCKTLSLRVERHLSNAQRLAELLASSPVVEQVNYPGLAQNSEFGTIQRLNGGNAGGLLSFTLKNDPDTTRAFIDALQLCTIAVSLGEATTLIWPYREGLIRLAVGLEDPEDLIADLSGGLAAATAVLESKLASV
jgi:cystathionine gamma-synthase